MTNSLATSFFQKTIFSGIQPSGVPHLGNYLGVFREWLRIQQFNHQHSSNTPIYFCIADLHALSSLTPPSPAELRENTLTLAKMLVALGIQPSSNVILFQQSAVPYHTQLQWLLTCRSPLGLLSRMSQWKAKTHVDRIVSEEPGLSSHLKAGLFVYPILQAADILLYRATDVPVGNDQLQHLEFSRDVAKFFNSTYKTNFFPFPKAVTANSCVRIMSLTDPHLKMSKSCTNMNSRILLTDSDTVIEKKIKGAVTDSIPNVTFDPKTRPGVSNLLQIYAGCQNLSLQDALLQLKHVHGLSTFKHHVTESVIQCLRPIRKAFLELDPTLVPALLDRGNQVAMNQAKLNWNQIAKIVGLL